MAFWKRIAIVAVLVATLFCVSGCAAIKVNETEPLDEPDNSTDINTYNGYEEYEIVTYEKLRAQDLLKEYGFTDYYMNGKKQHYNYTAEDFRNIEELDETYVYAMYIICDKETFEVILEALGYNNLEDYLVKMNYVNDAGIIDLRAWIVADLKQISEIMVEKSRD